MVKVLVVGGAGYIGSHVVKALLQSGHRVTVYDNLSSGQKINLFSEAAFVEADILDFAALDKAMAGQEAVVHLAAKKAVGESMEKPELYAENNITGSLNIMKAMLKDGVENMVFSSSAAVYGMPEYLPIDEKHPQKPINPYGRSKLMIEEIFRDYETAYGLKHISLRYFNAAGCSADGAIGESHLPETHLIPLVLKAVNGELETVRVFGTDYDTPDGTCIRDYIHVEDLAAAHRLALEKLGKYNGCVNLGTGIGSSVREIITAAEKVSGWRCPVEYAPRRPGDPAKLFADNRKAGEILGWRPRYTAIEEIIETAWKWETNRKY